MNLREYFKKRNILYYPIEKNENHVGILCKKKNNKTKIIGYLIEKDNEYIATYDKKRVKIKRL